MGCKGSRVQISALRPALNGLFRSHSQLNFNGCSLFAGSALYRSSDIDGRTLGSLTPALCEEHAVHVAHLIPVRLLGRFKWIENVAARHSKAVTEGSDSLSELRNHRKFFSSSRS